MAKSLMGKVISLAARKDGLYFQLDTDPKPLHKLFKLPIDHPNYDTYVTILIAAAVEKTRTVHAFCEAEISAAEFAIVHSIDFI